MEKDIVTLAHPICQADMYWAKRYTDAKPIKPHPAQMLKALEHMGVSAKDAISFGDRLIDIQASNVAGIESVACFWGTKEIRIFCILAILLPSLDQRKY